MKKKWFKLDNAAKIYPAFANENDTGTFRVAGIMKEEVIPDILNDALALIIDCYPSMKVKLKKGLFWYYFDKNNKIPKVALETCLPCSQVDDADDFLFKVYYYKNRIALECFHALTDGYGAFEFLKSLLVQYVTLRYKVIDSGRVKMPNQAIKPGELEDAYKRYAKRDSQVSEGVKSFNIKGKTISYEGSYVHHFKLHAQDLIKGAKKHDTTVTVLLAAIYYLSIVSVYQTKEPIGLTIPVNLRKIFLSDTLRNFTYPVHVTVPSDMRNLKAIIACIKKQLSEKIHSDYLENQFSRNVFLESSKLMKFTPNGIKDVILRIAKSKMHNKFSTSFISNPGLVDLPEDMKNYLDYLEFVLYASKGQPVNMGVCTYQNKMVITLARVLEDKELVESFTKTFKEITGINYDYYSNERTS